MQMQRSLSPRSLSSSSSGARPIPWYAACSSATAIAHSARAASVAKQHIVTRQLPPACVHEGGRNATFKGRNERVTCAASKGGLPDVQHQIDSLEQQIAESVARLLEVTADLTRARSSNNQEAMEKFEERNGCCWSS